MSLIKRDFLRPFVIAIILCACQTENTPTPIIVDENIITGDPCPAPCWQGLTPGQTPLEDANSFLEKSPLVSGNVGEQRLASTGALTQPWWWTNEKHDYSRQNIFDFDANGLLQNIVLIPNTDITIGEIIAIYGIPTLITMSVNGPKDIFASGPTGILLSALFVNNSFEVIWFEETTIVPRPFQFCFSLSLPVLEVTYTTPELMENKENSLRPTGSWPGSVIIEGSNVVQVANGQTTARCVQIP